MGKRRPTSRRTVAGGMADVRWATRQSCASRRFIRAPVFIELRPGSAPHTPPVDLGGDPPPRPGDVQADQLPFEDEFILGLEGAREPGSGSSGAPACSQPEARPLSRPGAGAASAPLVGRRGHPVGARHQLGDRPPTGDGALVDDPRQQVRLQAHGQVDDRPRRRGDAHAGSVLDVARVQLDHPVDDGVGQPRVPRGASTEISGRLGATSPGRRWMAAAVRCDNAEPGPPSRPTATASSHRDGARP